MGTSDTADPQLHHHLIARPLPSNKLSAPALPPRGIVYVVERLGRFNRLLQTSTHASPLLPLVDRVIAAYSTRRVDQATPPFGVLCLAAGHLRVAIHAVWQVRVIDPKRLAYRISDVDRCLHTLVHVRIREVLAALSSQSISSLSDSTVLSTMSENVRQAVDQTATKFGVACPTLKITAVTDPDKQQTPHTPMLLSPPPSSAESLGTPQQGLRRQRSLNLAEDNSPQIANMREHPDTVLPELPGQSEQVPLPMDLAQSSDQLSDDSASENRPPVEDKPYFALLSGNGATAEDVIDLEKPTSPNLFKNETVGIGPKQPRSTPHVLGDNSFTAGSPPSASPTSPLDPMSLDPSRGDLVLITNKPTVVAPSTTNKPRLSALQLTADSLAAGGIKFPATKPAASSTLVSMRPPTSVETVSTSKVTSFPSFSSASKSAAMSEESEDLPSGPLSLPGKPMFPSPPSTKKNTSGLGLTKPPSLSTIPQQPSFEDEEANSSVDVSTSTVPEKDYIANDGLTIDENSSAPSGAMEVEQLEEKNASLSAKMSISEDPGVISTLTTSTKQESVAGENSALGPLEGSSSSLTVFVGRNPRIPHPPDSMKTAASVATVTDQPLISAQGPSNSITAEESRPAVGNTADLAHGANSSSVAVETDEFHDAKNEPSANITMPMTSHTASNEVEHEEVIPSSPQNESKETCSMTDTPGNTIFSHEGIYSEVGTIEENELLEPEKRPSDPDPGPLTSIVVEKVDRLGPRESKIEPSIFSTPGDSVSIPTLNPSIGDSAVNTMVANELDSDKTIPPATLSGTVDMNKEGIADKQGSVQDAVAHVISSGFSEEGLKQTSEPTNPTDSSKEPIKKSGSGPKKKALYAPPPSPTQQVLVSGGVTSSDVIPALDDCIINRSEIASENKQVTDSQRDDPSLSPSSPQSPPLDDFTRALAKYLDTFSPPPDIDLPANYKWKRTSDDQENCQSTLNAVDAQNKNEIVGSIMNEATGDTSLSPKSKTDADISLEILQKNPFESPQASESNSIIHDVNNKLEEIPGSDEMVDEDELTSKSTTSEEDDGSESSTKAVLDKDMSREEGEDEKKKEEPSTKEVSRSAPSSPAPAKEVRIKRQQVQTSSLFQSSLRSEKASKIVPPVISNATRSQKQQAIPAKSPVLPDIFEKRAAPAPTPPPKSSISKNVIGAAVVAGASAMGAAAATAATDRVMKTAPKPSGTRSAVPKQTTNPAPEQKQRKPVYRMPMIVYPQPPINAGFDLSIRPGGLVKSSSTSSLPRPTNSSMQNGFINQPQLSNNWVWPRGREEPASFSRQGYERREKVRDPFITSEQNPTPRYGREDSSDEESNAWADMGSDSDRDVFYDAKGYVSPPPPESVSTRKRRHVPSSSSRREPHREERYYEESSSSDEVCTECENHWKYQSYQRDEPQRSRSRSSSRSSSKRRHHDEEDSPFEYYSERRRTSSTSKREERRSKGSDRVDSSRERSHRSKKANRDRPTERTEYLSEHSDRTSRSDRSERKDRGERRERSDRGERTERSDKSERSRSRSKSSERSERRRSDSKSRSSKKSSRESEDRRRKESKTKSKSRNKSVHMEYPYRNDGNLKSIYRHRLPEDSESGVENPIPWYCEGQSAPDDTDVEELRRRRMSEDRSGSKKPVYSSYGRRDKHGRRRRAHHNRNVTFLYDK